MPLDEWLATQPLFRSKTFFNQEGFVSIKNIISQDELHAYRDMFQKFMDGHIQPSSVPKVPLPNPADNVMQVVGPSSYIENLANGPLHVRANAIAKLLFGADMVFDFDRLVAKRPSTATPFPAPVPWHQDQAYWSDLPDKRAVSCWAAVDNACVDNGCLWFGPGSHRKPTRPHQPTETNSRALATQFDEEKAVAVPLLAGSATFHHANTLHYSRPNMSTRPRRAYVLNFRPKDMVDYIRRSDASN